jgi:hypothetical protein
VYRRAELWRTLPLVVALLFTAVSTGIFARERAAGPPIESQPRLQALRDLAGSAAERDGLEHIRAGAIYLNRTNVALIGTMAPVLIARLRRVE